MADSFPPQWDPAGLNAELKFKQGDTISVGDACYWDAATSTVRPASLFPDTGDGPTQQAFAAVFAGISNSKQRSTDTVGAVARMLTDKVITSPCVSATFLPGDYLTPVYTVGVLSTQSFVKTVDPAAAIARSVTLAAVAVTKVKARFTARFLTGALPGVTAQSGASPTIGASTAAAGSTTTDAGVLPAATATTYPTTASDGTKGVRVNVADKVLGRMLFIGNGVSNQIMKVYPPSGGTINGAGADVAFSSVSGKGVIMQCLSASSNTWLAW